MFRLLKYLKPRDYIFFFCAFAFIFGQVYLELLMPDFTKNLTAIVNTEGSDMGEVWFNGGMMLLCAGGAMACAIASSFFVSFIASHFSASLRKALFEKIMSFSSKEIHRFHTASLITRTTNDVVQLQNFLAMGLAMLIRAPIMAIIAILKISSSDISWTIATVTCVGIIAFFVIIGVFAVLPKFTKIQQLTDDLNASARENVTGVRIIRAFNAESYQGEKYEKVNKNITGIHLFVSRFMGLFNPLLTLAMNGLILAIYWIAAVLINKVEFNPATMEGAVERVGIISDMAAFSQYAIQVIMAFLMLVVIFVIMPRTIVSAKRIREVLKVTPSIVDGKEKPETEENNGVLQEILDAKIVFDHVNFSYSGDEHYAIKDANLVINKGETVAFIGATGCGKTTLINLMMRFYDVGDGSVLVDGKDVRSYRLSDLRGKISLAPQKAGLLKGTISSNVAYGHRSVDKDRLNSSLDIACCDFVSELENGVDSPVAQGGTNYSGGQKQRLSIARAIYKDADILIFDDSFSALDFKTDSQVRKNIRKKCEGKTVLIVAQRIGTIRNADKIVVMDKGEIVGVGTHKDLLESNQVYREIALSQLAKEEL